MIEIRIVIDESGSPPDDDLVQRLIGIARMLDPTSSIDPRPVYSAYEIFASSPVLPEPQVDLFADKLSELSSASGQAFTVFTTLDHARWQELIQRFPQFSFSNEHVLHVRPNEEATARGYFRCMFGAA